MAATSTPPAESGARGGSRPETVYFYGNCLVDLFYPEAGMAGIELLRRQGLAVVFPQGQTCCAQPAFNCGYTAEARAVARAQIALFPEPWPIVVPSGSCAAMMKRHYPGLFAGEPDLAAAEAFASAGTPTAPSTRGRSARSSPRRSRG